MKQAVDTAEYIHTRMLAGNLNIGCIMHSEMTRAVETAEIIWSKLKPLQPSLTLKSSNLLDEGTISEKPWISPDVHIIHIAGMQHWIILIFILSLHAG